MSGPDSPIDLEDTAHFVPEGEDRQPADPRHHTVVPDDLQKTLDFWAGRARERLAAFRRFDAAESAFEKANSEP